MYYVTYIIIYIYYIYYQARLDDSELEVRDRGRRLADACGTQAIFTNFTHFFTPSYAILGYFMPFYAHSCLSPWSATDAYCMQA